MSELIRELRPLREETEGQDDEQILLEYRRLYSQAAENSAGFSIGEVEFAAYLGNRLPALVPLLQELRSQMHIDELYLACGCVAGDESALSHFYNEYAPQIRASLSRLKMPAHQYDEILAILFEKLLVRKEGKEPKLGDYQGQGKLLTWLRVVALRTAISELRKKRVEIPDDGTLLEIAAPSGPQKELIRHESRQQIKEAFEQGIQKLSPRQRNLLRQQLLDGLSIDELGRLYRVHRVTAARWLNKAKAELWGHAKLYLMARLQVSSSQIESILGIARSTLDLSIERILLHP